MQLKPGAKLGPYELVAPIGKGGMGEVWRARDPRLGRDVAIKFSSQQFTDRFDREARAIASLNHPNICTLHDIGPDYLVMELIEGPTLAERIGQGLIPPEESIRIAKQIAGALEAAHGKGIVHRDLKPANIKIRPDGSVKVLDFGLAKAAIDALDLTPDSPTMMSETGAIVGTAGYMSPEQARGQTVDRRTDIWAFGVVLYEMLTGQRLFKGESFPDTLAAVLTREPDLERVPVEFRRLLRRCLVKDVNQRLRDASGIELLLEGNGDLNSGVSSGVTSGVNGAINAAPAVPVPNWRLILRGTIAAAAVFAISTAALSFFHFREAPPELRLVRSVIPPPDKTSFGFDVAPFGVPALSPDGSRLVFGARTADGIAQLWVRPLDSLTPQPLPGTEGATFAYPFWAQDGRSLGFGAAGKLMRIDLAGGPPVTLTDAPNFRGATWNSQGVILYTPNSVGPILRIAAAGGPSAPATTLDPARKETSHRFPWFLPDGRHFLYSSVVSNTNDATIYIGSLDSRDTQIVLQANSNAVYASGYLLFLRENTLMAQPFDAKRLTASGDAAAVASQIADNSGNAVGFFTASENGTLVFQSGSQDLQTLTWLDRTGKRVGTVGEPGLLSRTFLSPDGKHATVSALDRTSRNNDLWIYDLARNLRTRFTFDPANELEGVWSPNGSEIVFSSNRKGHFDIYRKLASGEGGEELLYADGLSKYPTSWSPDGKFVMYYATGDSTTGYDLWILPLTGDRKPFPFLRTGFNELLGQFSPDGHWVAYTSDESGRYETYVAAFPGPGGKRQASSAGGFVPRWRADGKELFYVALDGRLMSAELALKGTALELGGVRALFGPLPSNGYQYDVSPDGQRILAVVSSEQTALAPLTMAQNWPAGLKK